MKLYSILLCAFITIITMCFFLFKRVEKQNDFWHIEKQHNVYWFVDPDQNKHFLLGVTSIHPAQYGINEPHYASTDKDNWAETVAQRIKAVGFTNAGAWSDTSIRPYIDYTMDLNLMLHSSRSITDPLWEQDIERTIKEQVRPEDKHLIGYYTDNELDWNYLEPYAKKYFETVHRLIKKYDPNHLILGVRFNKRPPISVLKASIGNVDVHSFNLYTDDGVLWRNMLKETHDITDCPIIISEFSFFAEENNSNNQNIFINSGMRLFGGFVSTQKERAQLYEEFMKGLLNCSFIVGAEWFQWNDEPPSGRRSDSESFNFGIVDIYDKFYPEMVNAIKKISFMSIDLHMQSNEKQKGFTWKDDPKREYGN